jgi:hypothetical protein
MTISPPILSRRIIQIGTAPTTRLEIANTEAAMISPAPSGALRTIATRYPNIPAITKKGGAKPTASQKPERCTWKVTGSSSGLRSSAAGGSFIGAVTSLSSRLVRGW